MESLDALGSFRRKTKPKLLMGLVFVLVLFYLSLIFQFYDSASRTFVFEKMKKVKVCIRFKLCNCRGIVYHVKCQVVEGCCACTAWIPYADNALVLLEGERRRKASRRKKEEVENNRKRKRSKERSK